MAAGQLIIGVDLGTSGCKMVLVDEGLDVVASTLQTYGEPVLSPHPGWREQNPHVWWQAVEEGIRELAHRADDPKLIRAIGLTG